MKKALLIAISAAAVIACVIGCQGMFEKIEIKIGAVLPLTGDIAEYGRRCKAGMDIATEEINKSGGINGKAVSIMYEDSRGIPKEGVSAIQKLISINRVKIVIGAVASSVTLAMEPIATKNKVILFSPASSSPKLTGISKYFFRNWPSDVFEATVLAEFVYSKLGLKKVAMLYVNNDYGLGLKTEFSRRFKGLGGEITIEDTYAQGAMDFKTQLAKIKVSKPEAIYLAGYHREMAFATKQIRELGITTQILGDGDYGVPELLKITGKSSEGAIFSIPEYDPHRGSESVKTFANKFYKKYRDYPTNFEANGYDAVRIITDAVKIYGMDTDKIADYIASLKHYQGASGDISYGENRDVIKPVSIKIVKNNQFELYEPK